MKAFFEFLKFFTVLMFQVHFQEPTPKQAF